MSNRRLLLGQINDQLGDGIALDKIGFTSNNRCYYSNFDVSFDDGFIGGTPTKITISSLGASYLTNGRLNPTGSGTAWLDLDLGWGFGENGWQNGLFVVASGVATEAFNDSGSGDDYFPLYSSIFDISSVQYNGTYYALPSTRPAGIRNIPIYEQLFFSNIVYETGVKGGQKKLTINNIDYSNVIVESYSSSNTYSIPNRSSNKMRLRASGYDGGFSFSSFSFELDNGTISHVKPFVRGGSISGTSTIGPEIGLYCDKTGKCISLNFGATTPHAPSYNNTDPSTIYY